ncbi:unnamed protein product [Adineta ricciae]|uniref:Uncharacterized protein n=1 Tax=Adineta ricciae TaxID=249248 RepID=A0A813W2Y1_ADIRI|nr:unnamed protein product [Adineta ricciae]
MSNAGETIFDRSTDNHDEIQNRLRNTPKTKKESSKAKNSPSTHKQKTKKIDTISSPASITEPTTIASIPTPLPLNMITPPKTEEDALHSMLMSWYMAGYHAGQVAAKNQKKNKVYYRRQKEDKRRIMGQKMTSPANPKPVVMMRMMAPTVITPRQRPADRPIANLQQQQRRPLNHYRYYGA